MPKGKNNVLEFYNKKNKKTICYFSVGFGLSDDIYVAERFADNTNVGIIADDFIRRIYEEGGENKNKKENHGSIWFEGVNQEDVAYRVVDYEQRIREMKLNRIRKG